MILAIGNWVLERAAAQMHAWRQTGIAPRRLAISLSLTQLKNGSELVESVKAVLERWQLTPELIEFDVTESMLAYRRPARTIRSSNCVTSVPRSQSPISAGNIRRSLSEDLSRRMPEDPAGDDARRSTMPARRRRSAPSWLSARELDLEVVAQGVETDGERELLRTDGPAVREFIWASRYRQSWPASCCGAAR